MRWLSSYKHVLLEVELGMDITKAQYLFAISALHKNLITLNNSALATHRSYDALQSNAEACLNIITFQAII